MGGSQDSNQGIVDVTADSSQYGWKYFDAESSPSNDYILRYTENTNVEIFLEMLHNNHSS